MFTAFEDMRISVISSNPGAGSAVTIVVQADFSSSVRQKTSAEALAAKNLFTNAFALFNLSDSTDI